MFCLKKIGIKFLYLLLLDYELWQPLALLMTVTTTHIDQEASGQVHKGPADCHLSLSEDKNSTSPLLKKKSKNS